MSRETLEAAFRLADDCDRVGGICTWSAGVLMHDIHERLWQQGVKGKGNFDAVVRQHTRFSPSYARRLMRLAKVTREDVERYGASKVMTIIAAPQDEWPKLFAEAGEMSVRELEQAVSQIKQAKHEAAVEAAAARNEETPKKRGRPKGSKSQKRREEGQAAALQVAEEALAKQPTTITVGARTDKTYRIDLESGEGRAELANDVRAVLRMIAPNAFELRFERIEDDADE